MAKKALTALFIFSAPLFLIAGCSTTSQPVAQTKAEPKETAKSQTPATPAKATPAAQTKAAVSKPLANAIYFDYDQFIIKEQYAPVIQQQSEWLRAKNGKVELQGNADERGSRDYNMALGQRRADAVKRALTTLGVKGDNVETISFGEDKPKSSGHDEAAWAQNRRVDFMER